MGRSTRRYGWLPDLPDRRDHVYLARLRAANDPLPNIVDLRDQCPPVYDQGQLGSCTANAIAGAVDYGRGQQGLAFVNPSRLMIYYEEREVLGTVGEDSGAMIRDGIKCVAQQGVCPESEWPYDISQYTVKPPPQAYADALKDHVINYARMVPNLDEIRGRLAENYPFVFGFTVYESFERIGPDGIMPMPLPNEGVLGGHAVMAVGYNDTSRDVLVRNSWGEGWGAQGYFWMPYDYILNSDLCDDFWVVKLVSP